MAQNAQNVQAQALLEAQRQVELGKIPLWHGEVTKDAFTAEQWIERITNCRNTANWNDQATIGYMYQALRGRAIHWFNNAKFRRVDMAVWQAVRDDFLKVYQPSKTIRSTIANLEVKQGANENVCDYASRVTIVVTDLYSIIEDYVHPADNELFGGGIAAIDAVGDLAQGVRRAAHDAIRLIGEDRVIQLIAVNLFVAGLKQHIRQKMVVRRYATFSAAFDAAMNLEVQLSEPKRNATVLALENDINEGDDEFAEEADEQSDNDDSDILAEINKLTAKLAKNKVKNNKNKKKVNGGGGAGSSPLCRYCKQPGHLQYTCVKRRQDRAPMVGQDGKPYRRRTVQEVSQVSPSNPFAKETPPPFYHEVAGIWQSPASNHLNFQ